MKRYLAMGILILAACAANAQQDLDSIIKNATGPVRVIVRHADPWMIKALLEGLDVQQPEISTLRNSGGGGGFGGGQFGGGQAGGNQAGFGGGQSGGGMSGMSGGSGMGPGNPNQGLGNGNASGGRPGGANGNAGQSRGLLPPGWIVKVNPTDNSIWIIPPRP
jgi:hypothetical protein